MSVLVQLCTLTFCSETSESVIVVKGRRDQAEKDLKKNSESEDQMIAISMLVAKVTQAISANTTSITSTNQRQMMPANNINEQQQQESQMRLEVNQKLLVSSTQLIVFLI
uniref:Uncharacterized protein n=1 Tax=Meloidogyne javanica TaxID=6303 RepID=A0A915MF75_MELJA